MAKPPSFFLIHGWILWAAWILFSLVQICSHRYFKHYWISAFWIHFISGMFITAVTLLYGIYGLYKMKWKLKEDLHAPMGLATTCLVAVLAASGILAKQRLWRAQNNTKQMLCWKKFHKVSLILQFLTLLLKVQGTLFR